MPVWAALARNAIQPAEFGVGAAVDAGRVGLTVPNETTGGVGLAPVSGRRRHDGRAELVE